MSPVVVIGAGPQGLAAAAHLLERGLEPLVLESGRSAASAVAEWSHVRLFSAWPELVDAAAARLLARHGKAIPTSGFPTGEQWRNEYLIPVAEALGEHVHYNVTVTGVSRKGRDLTISPGRSEVPFAIHLLHADGWEERIEADAVIDASGTWSTPGPAGAEGLPALGERAAHEAGVVHYRIPTSADAASLAGRHVVVVGNGHSSTTAVTTLARIVQRDPGTRVTWVLRRGSVGNTFGGGGADQLPERGALGERARAAVKDGLVELVTGFRTESVLLSDGKALLSSDDGRTLDPADSVVVLTGFRPDHAWLSELRLDLDEALQAPRRIAAEVDPNLHSCGDVTATGAADLQQPEKNFFIVGAKSYGRAPTFLALTGYEQVRSVVAFLAGDHDAATRVELVLPETGVCGGAGEYDQPAGTSASGSCCATLVKPKVQVLPQPVQLSSSPTRL